MDLEKIKNILQAVLMVSDRPMTLDKLLEIFKQEDEEEDSDVSRDQVKEALKSLEDEYEGKGVELARVASGYRFQVPQGFEPWVAKLFEEKPPRYSRALLETLAIIAYRQPVTRGEIEEIRGVAVSSHITKTLLEREWVRVIGHKDVPGKPALFGTTKEFLDYFNLKSLDELPSLAELRDLESFHPQLELDSNAIQSKDENTSSSEDAEAGDNVQVDNESTESRTGESEHANTTTNADEIAREVNEEPLPDGVAALLDEDDNDAIDQDEEIKA